MTTIYSPQYQIYDDVAAYLRTRCDYEITETRTEVIVSGTIYMQHNGAAISDPYWGGFESAIGLKDMLNSLIANTGGVESISKHSSWTTVKSKKFSYTAAKSTSKRTLTFMVGDYSGIIILFNVKNPVTFDVEISELPSYPVTFDSNGGSGGPTSQTKYEGINLTLSSSKPSKANYIFSHWNTTLDNSGTTYNPGDTYTTDAALDLYAIWSSKISYNGNGTFIDTHYDFPTQTKVYGTNLTLHSGTPTRTGYVFNGWNTAADGTGASYLPGATYSAEVSVTLYAQWLSLPAKPVISSMTAIRWNETTDQQDDEGTSAKITADWAIDTGSDYYGDSNTGTVSLVLTPQSGSSSHTITPVSGTSGTSGTAVFMVSGLDTDMQYNCTVTVTDLNASSNRTVILTRAFFIMDFKAGGRGIGIGRAAPNSGLEVGYATTFDDDVTMYENLIVSGNVVSPKMTGTPTAPTPSSGDDSTKVATTAFVKTAVDAAGGDAGTATPTANKTAKFDSNAHMNSDDMSAADIALFVSNLNMQPSPFVSYVNVVTKTVPNNTTVIAHSKTFESGTWLIITINKTLSGGSNTANLGQNRILKDGTLVYASKGQADTSIDIVNVYVLQNANNTEIAHELYQATGNSQTQECTFLAIKLL